MRLARSVTPVERTVGLSFSQRENALICTWKDFNPNAVIFRPDQYGQIVLSIAGIVLWIAGIGASIHKWGFLEVFRTYLVPYIWYVLLLYSISCETDYGTFDDFLRLRIQGEPLAHPYHVPPTHRPPSSPLPRT